MTRLFGLRGVGRCKCSFHLRASINAGFLPPVTSCVRCSGCASVAYQVGPTFICDSGAVRAASDCCGLGTMSLGDEVIIEACSSLAELDEVRGQLRKLRGERAFDREYMSNLFEKRDKQLFPRDLLAAFLPTRRSRAQTAKGRGGDGSALGRRAVGILRRSLRMDKRRHTSLYIDFVWVAKEARGLHIGRRLLTAGIRLGKEKDVRLLVAGSDHNVPAVALYKSVGFEWTSGLKTEMVLEKSMLPSAPPSSEGGAAASHSSGSAVARSTPSAMGVPTCAQADMSVADGVVSAEAPEGSGEAALAADHAPSAMPHPLCVNVGDAAESGACAGDDCGHEPTSSGATASGATPHLSQLRFSPRLRAQTVAGPWPCQEQQSYTTPPPLVLEPAALAAAGQAPEGGGVPPGGASAGKRRGLTPLAPPSSTRAAAALQKSESGELEDVVCKSSKAGALDSPRARARGAEDRLLIRCSSL